MKNLKILSLIVITLMTFTGCSATSKNLNNQNNNEQGEEMVKGAEDKAKSYNQAPGLLDKKKITNKVAIIETQKGIIKIELFADDAPLTVSNFVFLVEDGFYDGLIFHRVEPGFVAQGGDPNGNGTGGPGYTFVDEPVKKKYTKGIVAMANRGEDTNGSQFFIMLEDWSKPPKELPPMYTIFGQVIEGVDIVDKIAIGDKMLKVTIEDAKDN